MTDNNGDDNTGSDDTGREPLSRNKDADPVQVHRDYVERRIGGGAAPTTDAYARAIEQFQRLPGAVRMPPAEVTGQTVERRARGEQGQARPAEDNEAGPDAEDAGTGGVWEAER